jgi:hypothetical protein
LKCYRVGLLNFCGDIVTVESDSTEISCKEGFRLYDDGFYRGGKVIKSRHSNILKGVIIGKKSWGLWLNEWTDGISEGLFTTKEILGEFTERGITIPESFLADFYNRLYKKIELRSKIL